MAPSRYRTLLFSFRVKHRCSSSRRTSHDAFRGSTRCTVPDHLRLLIIQSLQFCRESEGMARTVHKVHAPGGFDSFARETLQSCVSTRRKPISDKVGTHKPRSLVANNSAEKTSKKRCYIKRPFKICGTILRPSVVYLCGSLYALARDAVAKQSRPPTAMFLANVFSIPQLPFES